MSRMGGTQYYHAFGCTFTGRGIRARRYLGRIRLVHQAELRWCPLGFSIFDLDVVLWAVLFADLGWIGVGWSDFGGDPSQIVWSAGTGIRIVWDRNFVLRGDLGVSPFEGFDPAIYIEIENVF